MSTKDISRSALEGGRYNGNKDERRESHVHERSRLREWLYNVSEDTETAEDSDPVPREPVRKGFTDKLNPCYRWLASRAGQPWSKVHSELRKTFDTRNLASWHIVNQHMLTEVEGAGTTSDNIAIYRIARFFIDDGGILRDRGKRWYRNTRKVYLGPTRREVFGVLGTRKVYEGLSGYLYWAWPGKGHWTACPGRYCTHGQHKHRTVDITPANVVEMYTVGTHRAFNDSPHWRKFATQHFVPNWVPSKRLTKVELAWWETIDWSIRTEARVKSSY